MLDTIGTFLDRTSLSPHGIALAWRPDLIWTHAASDLVIGLAFCAIALALAVVVARRGDIAVRGTVSVAIAFLLACAATRFLAIRTLWVPDHGAEVIAKAVTAAAALAMAILLWRLVPLALALPRPSALRRAESDLVDRTAERDAASHALQRAGADKDRAEAMLRQSQKMAAIGALAGGVANDVNTLLGIVIGTLDTLKRELADDACARASVRTALAGAERTASLVQAMLTVARHQPLQPTSVDANRLIEDLAELLRGALNGVGDTHLDLAPNLWSVRIDAGQLESVLLNLAVNARDAMPAGGRAAIRTRNVPATEASAIAGMAPIDHIAIAFEDTGCGMSAEVRERAFEPFFTTKAEGAGTGLGLSQVSSFVKRADGHAELVSSVGVGTTVRLFLPRHYPRHDPRPLDDPGTTRTGGAVRYA